MSVPETRPQSDLDPPRKAYFHGTRASLEVGGILRPRGEHGAEPTNAPMIPGAERPADADNYVYVTRRYGLACAYAHKSQIEGPPVVYLVKPQGEIESDPECNESEYAFRCASAVVIAVDDSPWVTAEMAERGWMRGSGSDPERNAFKSPANPAGI